MTTLERCGQDIEATRLEPPSLIVVGEVVRLREKLDWLTSL
jgi:uroporphyrin-III C-methyltransferase